VPGAVRRVVHSTRNIVHAHLSHFELGSSSSRLMILQDFKAAKYGHHELYIHVTVDRNRFRFK